MNEILNEKLFAKNNKNLNQIDNIFGEIIDIVQNDNSVKGRERMGGRIYNTKPINSLSARKAIESKLAEVGKLVSKEFGFMYVSIHLESKFVGANACTYNQDIMTNSLKTDTSRSSITDKGIKYEYFSNIRIYLGESLFTGHFEPREITAILLHEIGHQFFLNRNVFMFILQYMGEFITLLSPFTMVRTLVGESLLSTMNSMAKALDESKAISTIRLYVNNVKGYFKLLNIIPFFDLIPKIILVAIDTRRRGFIGPIDIASLISGTTNEKFADNFATSYGYGAELSKGIEKLNTLKTVKDIPVLSTLEDVVYLPFKIIGYLVDCHPNPIDRCRAQIKYVNSQISQLPDGPLKNSYKQDVKNMEKIIDTMATNIASNDAQTGKVFSAMFNLISLKLFKGYSLQSLIPTPGNNSPKKDWQQFM